MPQIDLEPSAYRVNGKLRWPLPINRWEMVLTIAAGGFVVIFLWLAAHLGFAMIAASYTAAGTVFGGFLFLWLRRLIVPSESPRQPPPGTRHSPLAAMPAKSDATVAARSDRKTAQPPAAR